MTGRLKTVTVKDLPEKLDSKNERALFAGLRTAMNVERPALVLNCSHLREMDVSSVHLLLCCLEEAMKRNGDVRLAGVSAEAKESLRSMGVERLFRTFETSEQAVESFHRRAVSIPPFVGVTAAVPAENAA
ncbi:MAG TPA: STAS domain-containing protein [Terracidiphilus sp.]|jgi:anti-anti-sigma factor